SMFVYYSAPFLHRHLHSFPTRRSSDLRSESLEDFDCGIFRALADRGLSNDLADLLQSPTVLLSMLVWRRHSGPRFRGHILYGLRDRKSTRLNSSHEWISYAVFCLKKKN